MKRIQGILLILLLAFSLIGAAPATGGPQFKLIPIGHAVYVDASESGQVISSIVLPDGSKVTGRDTAYWRAIDYGNYSITVADSQGRVSTQEYTLSMTDGLCYSASLNGTGQIDTEIRLKVQTNYAEAYFRTIVPGGATIYVPNSHIDPASMSQQEGQYSMVHIDNSPTLVRFVNDKYVSMRGVTESGNVTNFNILFLFPGQINVDLNGDGTPDVNLDNDGDGVVDTNIDDTGDGLVNRNPGVWKDPSSSSSTSSSSSSSSSAPSKPQTRPQVSTQAANPFAGFDQGQTQVDNKPPSTPTPRTEEHKVSAASSSSSSSTPQTYTDMSPSGLSENDAPKTYSDMEDQQTVIATFAEQDNKVVVTLPNEDAAIDSKRMAGYLRDGTAVEVVVESPSSQATFNPNEDIPPEFKEQADKQMADLIFFLDGRELVTGKELNDYVWSQALSMLDSFSNNPVAQTEVKSNPTTGR